MEFSSKTEAFWSVFGKPNKSQLKAFNRVKKKYGELLSQDTVESEILRLKYTEHEMAERELDNFKNRRKLWKETRRDREQIKTAVNKIRDSKLIPPQEADKLVAQLLSFAQSNNPAHHPVFAANKKLPEGTLKEFRTAQRKQLYEKMGGFPSSHKSEARPFSPKRDFKNEILYDIDGLLEKKNKGEMDRYRDVVTVAKYCFPKLFRGLTASRVKGKILYMRGMTHS